MSRWYEVFENEQVQLATRKQAAVLVGVVVIATALTVSGLALGHSGLLPLPLIIAALVLTWLGTLRWVVLRFNQLRQVVWCVKMSDRLIAGYDYTRRKRTLDWMHVERIELTEAGLMVVGPDACTFEVSHLFPDFSELSHRIVQYAESYGIPVCMHGQPLQHINIYTLYPFLLETTSPPRPDTLA